MLGGPTPDIPKAYVLALLQAIAAVAVAFGVRITKQQQYSIEALSGLLAVGIIWGYNHLAKHRLQNLEKLGRPAVTPEQLAQQVATHMDTMQAMRNAAQCAPPQPTTERLGYG